MAEGVGNAAVIIPFMTEQYEASTNCKLELKFSQQTGVPIVPVMMQKDYKPQGWRESQHQVFRLLFLIPSS